MKVTSYKDLTVWQKAMDLVDEIYTITEYFPQSQKFSLVDQMQRAAVSIPSNIAEGSRRSSRDSYSYFLHVAYSSGAELETQLEISRRRNYCIEERYEKTSNLLSEVMKMLNRIVANLNRDPTHYSLQPTH